MCGIIGYVGDKNAAPIVMAGLRRLEYRGYDSAGIAVISKGKLQRRRSVGKVELLSKMLEEEPLNGTLGIGHTRWATHGKPSQDNAHPHTDCEGKVVVVHNGIIENYIDIRERLQADGHKFSSETDTEVIAHLVEHHLKRLGSGGKAFSAVTEPLFFEAVRQTVREMEGAYAIGILWEGCPGTIIGARKQSPLVVGAGQGENFLASDVSAFLDRTRKVLFLNDGDIAILSASGIKLFNLEGKKQEIAYTNVQWDQTMAEKGGYKHFMLKEIHEQPTAVEDTLRGALLPLDDKTMKAEFGFDSEIVGKIEKIQIVACGTAYHAGLVGEYVIEHFSGIPVHVDLASEFRYREAPVRPNTLLIAISQSGETADTLAAVRENKKNGGVHTLAICNVVGSSLTREAQSTFHTRCGPEIGVASTKAFVGQLTALFILSLHLGVARGKLSRDQGIKYAQELLKLPQLMREALKLDGDIKAMAERLAQRGHYLFLGRNANYPIALEGALKLKEISYLHAEGFAGGEMKHGPIAIIDEGMPVLGIAVKSQILDKMLSNLQEAKARGAYVVAIVSQSQHKLKGDIDFELSVPLTDEYFSPALTVIPLQLFAYYVAAARGCDIDKPRNLAKSVTVE